MKITIEWDHEKQTAKVDFDKEQFKTWDMLMAVLEIAKEQATFNRDVQRQMMYQEKMMEQQQSAQLQSAILNCGRR